jgi:hypothetical protein
MSQRVLLWHLRQINMFKLKRDFSWGAKCDFVVGVGAQGGTAASLYVKKGPEPPTQPPPPIFENIITEFFYLALS